MLERLKSDKSSFSDAKKDVQKDSKKNLKKNSKKGPKLDAELQKSVDEFFSQAIKEEQQNYDSGYTPNFFLDSPDLNPDNLSSRQQRKLIKYFSIIPDEINLPNATELTPKKRQHEQSLTAEKLRDQTLAASDAKITESMRQKVLDHIAQGQITNIDLETCLEKIIDPIHSAKIGVEQMFTKINQDPRQKQILALLIGQPLNQTLTPQALTNLLKPSNSPYRTPVGFAVFEQKFLSRLQNRVNPSAYTAYQISLQELQSTLYGKRLEYYHEFQKLQQSAATPPAKLKPAPRMSAIATQKPTSTPSAQNVPKSSAPAPSSAPVSANLVRPLQSVEADSLLARANISGDAWHQNGREYHLSVNYLQEAGLAPAYETTLESHKIGLSKPFHVSDNRIAIIAYLVNNTSVNVCSYYRDRLLGVWRYLPDYVRAPQQDSRLNWCGQGYGEASITLPIRLQAALSSLTPEIHLDTKNLTVKDPDFYFVGMTKSYPSKQLYAKNLLANQMSSAYYQEVSREQYGHFRQSASHKIAPYTLSVNAQIAPNFQQKIADFTTSSMFSDDIHAQGFTSYDGQYNWLMYTDSKKRTWIGAVEVISPLTSVGLRSEWTKIGDLGTPLYDYAKWSDGYGDPRDIRGAYQCMWKRYLSQIPLIRDYTTQVIHA